MPTSDFSKMVSLAQLTKLLPESVHISTIYRWVQRGIRGKKLKTLRIGGRLYITPTALNEFFESSEDQSSAGSSVQNPSSAALKAERFLINEGV